MPSPSQVADFRARGFHFPVRVMTEDEAGALAERIIAFDQGPVAARYADVANSLYRFKTYLVFEWADTLVHHPRILDAAEAVIGPDLLVWSVGMFLKKPRSPGFVSWHQDATYYGLDDADKVVNVWVALTPATLANGAMRFAPGSHRLGQVPHRETYDRDNLISRGEVADVAIDEGAAVDVLLGAGEASLHHLYLLHSSAPNRSDDHRVGIVIRFIRPDVKPLSGRDCAMLVRGEDRFGHFELEPRLRREMDADAMAAHARAMAIRDGNTGHRPSADRAASAMGAGPA
ncbi:MAG: phytanoyl-CoA dioxygenase family protein [Ectothiorhodospiraceae bacterium]|nr:phytanoyl-CoA dioxygenase family protein [Chromatiales bacterium]MCP5157552.1 phytanoyl-CoA dioxygenase family protein [Ectothiorhodospiraceae bacterium]